jgi:hypothetical protein
MCEIHYDIKGNKHVNYCQNENIDFVRLGLAINGLKFKIVSDLEHLIDRINKLFKNTNYDY